MDGQSLKSLLQLALDTGEIADMDGLFEHVRAHELVITRNGHDYLGLCDAKGKRFRVRFKFENHTRPPRPGKATVSDPLSNPHKTRLQCALNNGEISDMQQLLLYLAAHKLVVTVVRPYLLGLRGSDGRAFAIALPFEYSVPSGPMSVAVGKGGAMRHVPRDLRGDLHLDQPGMAGRRSAGPTARALSTCMQRAVDLGEVRSMAELLVHVAERGLQVVRSVDGCVTLKAGRTRFRLRHHFNDGPKAARPQFAASMDRRIWVYALTAFSRDGTKRACYIGKTVDLSRRMREHRKVLHSRRVRSSYELFSWASAEDVEVRVTVLAVMDVDWFQSPLLEGYWLKLAQEAGYETPGSDRWGRLPKPVDLEGQPFSWPWERVALAALALEEMAEKSIPPAALYEFPNASAKASRQKQGST